MEETKEPIKDEEMENLVNKDTKIDYHDQLKELIKNSVHGTRMAICSSISKSVSVDALVTAYEQNMGYEFSKGTVVLDDISLEKAAIPLYNAVSKELGIEVSNLSDKQLNQIVMLKIHSDPIEFAKKVNEIREEGDTRVRLQEQDNRFQGKLQNKDAREGYIFDNVAMANAREVNEYEKFVSKTGAMSKEAISSDIEKVMNNTEQVSVPAELKKLLEHNVISIRENYDVKLVQLIQLSKDFKYATFAKEVYSEKIKEFVKENPKLESAYDEISKNPNNIPEKYMKMINNYEDNLATIAAISSADKFFNCNMNNLAEDEKKKIFSDILSATINKSGGEIIADNDVFINILEQLGPDLNLQGKDGKKDIRNLFENDEELKKLQKYLPINKKSAELNSNNIKNVLKMLRIRTIRSVNERTIEKLNEVDKFDKSIFSGKISRNAKGFVQKIGRRKQEKITNELMEDIWENSAEEIRVNAVIDRMEENIEGRFFEGSNMNFTKTDASNMQELYEKSTIECWISSKEQYLDLRYAALHQIKSELEGKDQLTELEKNRLELINYRIQDFHSEHPDYDTSRVLDGSEEKLTDDIKYRLSNFEDYKVKSKIISTFIRNSISINSYEDYSKLDDNGKKEYLKNTIAALSYKGSSAERKSKIIGKFAERSLEIINSDESKFIDIYPRDVGYNSTIHEEKILEEYNKYSKHKFQTFKELKQYCESNKSMYVAEKLDEYEDLRDEDFVDALGDTTSEKVKFIESMKFSINERDEKAPKIERRNRRASSINRIESKKDLDSELDLDSKSEFNGENEKSDDRSNMTVEEINVSHEDIEPDSELPVPVKESFFKKIVNKVKEIFTSTSKQQTDNSSDKENLEMIHQDVSQKETFDEALRKGTENVNVLEAVRYTQDNSGNAKQIDNDRTTEEL